VETSNSTDAAESRSRRSRPSARSEGARTHDELRRLAQDTQTAHVEALRPVRRAFARIFGDHTVPSAVKTDLATPGLHRRGFLRVGGLTIASAAIFAACGGNDDDANSTATTGATSTTAAGRDSDDVMILRTASSVEALAVAAYQTAIDSGLVSTAAVADAAKLFQGQHSEHLELFAGLTEQAGGMPFRDPNPAILEQLQPRVDALSDEKGVVQLAYDLEVAAAETYQSNVSMFADASLNAAIMSVGGVESRHVAVLASVLRTPAVPVAFQVTERAVAAGTGV
jgi:Ferritin-like domain